MNQAERARAIVMSRTVVQPRKVTKQIAPPPHLITDIRVSLRIFCKDLYNADVAMPRRDVDRRTAVLLASSSRHGGYG